MNCFKRRFTMTAALAAVFIWITSFAAAQTVTLSTGASCTYSAITIVPPGSLAVVCAGATPPQIIVPPVVVPPATPVPTVPVPPAACGRDIPFARYLAEGCDLLCVQTSRGWGGLVACEFEAAYAAGYPRPGAVQPGTGGAAPRPMPTDDLTGYENGGFIPQHQFPSSAIRWTASRSGPALFRLVEETHPSAAQNLTATVTDSTGALVGSLQTGRPIAATVDVSFNAVADRTYYLTVTPDAPLWRHIELRTQ